MSTKVNVPALPESVADATILTWHKSPGDKVERDENLVDLETDKVVLEVPSPMDGVLGQVAVNEGDTVQAGDLLAVIEAGAAVQPAKKPTGESGAPAQKEEAETDAQGGPEPVLTPAVRRLVKEMGIHLNKCLFHLCQKTIEKNDNHYDLIYYS